MNVISSCLIRLPMIRGPHDSCVIIALCKGIFSKKFQSRLRELIIIDSQLFDYIETEGPKKWPDWLRFWLPMTRRTLPEATLWLPVDSSPVSKTNHFCVSFFHLPLFACCHFACFHLPDTRSWNEKFDLVHFVFSLVSLSLAGRLWRGFVHWWEIDISKIQVKRCKSDEINKPCVYLTRFKIVFFFCFSVRIRPSFQ